MSAHEDVLPERTGSAWLENTDRTSYPRLTADRSVEAVVVGGGIAGLSAAANLAEAGVDVVLLEADRIGAGATSRSTAKVTAQHGLIYADLVDRFGPDRARRYAAANAAAIEEVADRSHRMSVDAQFRRRPAYTYLPPDGSRRRLEREAETARRFDLPATVIDSVPLPVESAGAIRFDDQAEFHPQRYLVGLARQVDEAGGIVRERTRAVDLASTGRNAPRVETETGVVTADAVIVASHFPFEDRAGYFARLHPKRSYLLAASINGAPPNGMFYRPTQPYRSVRSHRFDGEELLLVGGQDHKTGHGDETIERYRELARFASRRFDVESIEHRWSTQDYVTVDGLPYVGRLGPGSDDVYVATGFGGWGMTNGTAAGMMLAEVVQGREPSWLSAFEPNRLTGVRKALVQNAGTATDFAGGWFDAVTARGALPAAGEARVVRRGRHPVGVYRDEDGGTHAVSAICTHMACILKWNDAERSWDCPCHGSRFTSTGEVVEGPARRDLPSREVGQSRDRPDR